MADPYVPAKPGEPILADNWNSLQTQIREHIRTHTHAGGEQGQPLTGQGIHPDGILSVKQLTVGGSDVNDRLKKLEEGKLSVTGGTLTGQLTVNAGQLDAGLEVRLKGFPEWDRFVVTTTKMWSGDSGGQFVTIGAGGAVGIMLSNPHVPWYKGNDPSGLGERASIRYGRTKGALHGTWWDVGVRDDGSFSFVACDWEPGQHADRLTILEKGGVKVNGHLEAGDALISGGLTVTGTASAGTLTFPRPPGDPAPVITARPVPADQGGKNEMTELILFHSNDGLNGCGPDMITLRAPQIRLQTYNDPSVSTIGNHAGSIDRFVIDPLGKIACPMWSVKQLMSNVAGPSEQKTASYIVQSLAFTSQGGTLVFFVSASGWSGSGKTIRFDVNIDKSTKGSLSSYTNEGNSHKSVVANPVVVPGLVAGSHTFELVLVSPSSWVDLNDYFSVTLMELPF